MKKIALLAIGLTGLALCACAPRYYDDRYDRSGYYGPRDHYGYVDRDRDGYADRDGAPGRYDRDRDGVPNYADRRPDDPYRN